MELSPSTGRLPDLRNRIDALVCIRQLSISEKGGCVNILICLKSRVISEALYDLLKKEANEDRIFVADGEIDNAGCQPDIILMDCHNLNQKLLLRKPDTKVLMIDTGLEQEDVINLLLAYNLDGVLSTKADATLLKKALNLVHEGQIWIDNNNLKALLCRAGTISKTGKVNMVSKREQQILDLIKKGHKNKEIAAQLFLSEQTIKAHVSRIFRKFNVSTRSQLISLLMKNHSDVLPQALQIN